MSQKNEYTLIQNGTVVNSDMEFKADVLINKTTGIIEKVAEGIDAASIENVSVINAEGKYGMSFPSHFH